MSSRAPSRGPSQTDTFPHNFPIGNKQTSGPLVTPEQIKGHLGLLRLFHQLRQTVEEAKDERFLLWENPKQAPRRWGCFVAMAVERFERWCLSLRAPSTLEHFIENSLPPLDVIMVWHAYLLNPGWYAEDSIRLFPVARLDELNMLFVSNMENIDTLVSAPPSQARMQNWIGMTGTPFDPLDAMSGLQHFVQCPACTTQHGTPFFKDNGTGYAQTKFLVTCVCGFGITKLKLGCYKYIYNLGTPASSSQYAGYLAGTLFTSTKMADTERAGNIKGYILGAFEKQKLIFSPEEDVTSATSRILFNTKYNMGLIKYYTGAAMFESGGRLLRRIISAYTDDRIFSIDLAGAVMRQGSFISKMQELKWTEPSYFDGTDDVIVLQHCVARYHAFLDLMNSTHGDFYVPTLDIDLAWHTHQLRARPYRDDCAKYIGRYIDHNDKVKEEHLSTSFELTCKAWQDRFNVPYMHCGCPLPGDTIGQKLLSKISRQSHQPHPPYLLPSTNPDMLQGTHPSDHNAVFDFDYKQVDSRVRTKRKAEGLKRRSRDAKKVEKGKFDRALYERGGSHTRAFLIPIPLYYNAFVAKGPIAPCVAFSGGVNSGLGSCGATAASCGVGKYPGNTACGVSGGAGCGAGAGCGSGGGGCFSSGAGSSCGGGCNGG